MNADSFFTIGSTHKVCQDYAVSMCFDVPPPDGGSYTILSDGCSTAPDTDFGSRLLVRSAQSAIYKHDNLRNFLYDTLKAAEIYSRTLSLPSDSLSATLLASYYVFGTHTSGEINPFRNDKIVVVCVGDGAIVAKDYDGGLSIFEYEFKRGAPYYLRYELDGNNKDRYFKEFGNELEMHLTTVNPAGEITQASKIKPTFDKETHFWFHEFSLDRYETVAIMSDGIQSFVKQEKTGTSKQNLPVESIDIIKELMDFKNYSGEFVQRRCQRAFRKFRENNIQNCDDFSMGVITTRS